MRRWSRHSNLCPSSPSCRRVSATPALLDLYRATHYDVRMPGGKRVTLRIGDQIPRALLDWAKDARSLVIVSASNPESRALPVMENRQRMRALLDRLSVSRKQILAGVGHIPGQGWRESFLVIAGIAIQEADLLAVEFGQNATVVADGHSHVARLRIY